MKQLLIVAVSALVLTACASKDSDDKKSGNHSMPAPSSHVGQRTLFSNMWKEDYSEGTVLMQFSSNSITATNYCKNGQVASVTVRARNTSTHIQVLESKESGDKDCYATADAGLAYSYSIVGDRLVADGGSLQAY